MKWCVRQGSNPRPARALLSPLYLAELQTHEPAVRTKKPPRSPGLGCQWWEEVRVTPRD